MKPFLSSMIILLMPSLAAFGAGFHFLDPERTDLIELLPPPPAAGSAAATIDMDAVLLEQITRTDAEIARAKSEITLTPVAFQTVLGPAFTADNMPHVYALLKDAEHDSKILSTKAKTVFARLRPKFVDSHVAPIGESEDGPAYPSGHATRAMLWAWILSEVVPDKKHELLDRGEEIGWDRVIIGVHFPSDVFAGEVLGQAIAHAISKNEEFEKRVAEAKEEFHSASAPHPAVTSNP